MRLVHEAHQAFFDQARVHHSVRRNVQGFDPTEYTDYALPPDNAISVKAKAAATDYFKAHPVDLIEATGTDLHSDLTYDLLLALDPKASLIFSFICNLQD